MLSLTQFGKFGAPSMPPEWLLKGFPEFGSGSSGPSPRLFRERRDRKKLRIANFVGLSGPSGIWGPASINSTLLGVSEKTVQRHWSFAKAWLYRAMQADA